MNESIEAIRVSVPDLAEETIRKLPLSAVFLILKFIRGELDASMAPVGRGAAASATEGDDAKKSD
jgi:hypothetical protein